MSEAAWKADNCIYSECDGDPSCKLHNNCNYANPEAQRGPQAGEQVEVIVPQSAEVCIANNQGKESVVILAMDNHSHQLRRIYAMTVHHTTILISALMQAKQQIENSTARQKLILPPGVSRPPALPNGAKISITKTRADLPESKQ